MEVIGKIKYISNIPVPYVVAMLNVIGKECDVEAVFEAESYVNHNKLFYNQNNINFKITFLKKGNINSKRINLKIIKHINRDQDILIMTCYTEMTELVGLLWAKLIHIPYYLEVDGARLHEESFWKKYIKRFLIKGAKGYISSGRTTDKYLVHYGVPQDRIFHYPFSSLYSSDILKAPVSDEQKQSLRNKLGIQGKRVVVTVGRYVYIDKNGNEFSTDISNKANIYSGAKLIKGFDILIRAFSKLPTEYELIIIGGEPTEEIKELVDSLSIRNVSFINFMPREKVFEYYKCADLFCLQTRGDAWGLVINEAMASGLPVISTDKCVAALELIEPGKNGYVVNPEDITGLYNAMNKILLDKETINRMGKESIQIIQNYTYEKMAETHLKILEKEACAE